MAFEPTEDPRPPGTPEIRRLSQLGVVASGVVILALIVASVPLQSSAHMWSQTDTATFPVAFCCFAVGLLLAARRPTNVMGWCLLAGALFLTLNIAASAYSVLDYRAHHALPLGGAAVLLQPSWAPAIILFGLALMLFPDGRFSSRVVKWMLWLVLAIGAVWMAGAFGMAIQALLNHAVRVDSAGNLVGVDHPRGSWAWWAPIQDAFFLVLGASGIAWIVLQVPRYRRAGDEERHQMKWLISGAAVAIVCGILATSAGSGAGLGWVSWVGTLGLLVLPVTLAIGVTKFHLYDIDRLLSRTLSYMLLTGLVVGVYVGVVTLVTKGMGFSSPVGVATSTLVAAAAFNPLRKRLQRGVDRRFNRARYNAERTVSAFAARLRESVDPGSVTDDLLGELHAAFQPDAAFVWVRREPR